MNDKRAHPWSWFSAAAVVCAGLSIAFHPVWAGEKHDMNLDSPSPSSTSKPSPAEGAKVQIISPKKNQVLTSQDVVFSYRMVRGKRGSHVHAYLDGKSVGMFAGNSGTLTSLAPGKHRLELRVIADDHVTELDAGDVVEFETRAAR